MGEEFETVTIFFKNGEREICDAFSITESGVYTAHVSSSSNGLSHAIENGFIPKEQIKRIIISHKDGTVKKIDF